MAGEPGTGAAVLRRFSRRSRAEQVRKFPDAILRAGGDAASWPALDGVTGIFFTSRTGSTALVREAERAFTLGHAGESLNAGKLQRLAQRHGFADLREALAWLIAESAPAGWFLFKAGSPGLLNAARIGFLDRYAALIRPVFLMRRDVLGQALSIVAAEHTRRFHSTQTMQRDWLPEHYDYHAIRRQIRAITDTNARIAASLPCFRHPPQVLFYEDFRDGDFSLPLRILSGTGLPHRPRLLPDTGGVEKATHPLTAAFRARFLKDASWRGRRLLDRHARFVDRWQARRDG